MQGARPSLAAACAAAILVFAAAGACAQAVYRWTDADGKVHYGDRIPKGFTGAVTRIETDTPAAPGVAPATPGVQVIAPPKRTEVTPPPREDIAKQRRETREKLGERVSLARERLAAARKKREDGDELQEDEHQVVQQHGDPARFANVPRSNCTFSKDNTGRVVEMCPTLVPGEAYWDRIRNLDDAVKSAEEELAAAQEAYRRGVD
ncbi:MAG TPA: DUF4124 domain-containing protein [Usitatibacter sp.]|jgi:hypothetical protein|nr:DUF4124 domain-containing protein [Usitatibacter sp.]